MWGVEGLGSVGVVVGGPVGVLVERLAPGPADIIGLEVGEAAGGVEVGGEAGLQLTGDGVGWVEVCGEAGPKQTRNVVV